LIMTACVPFKLGDPAAKYLPPRLAPPRQAGRQISLLELATHTSALPLLPSNIHPKNVANPYADYTLEMLEQFLAGYALPWEIGARYQYSAVGLGLLGHALGRRLGLTWEAAVTKRILAPLGMSSTRATLPPDLSQRMAQGHDDRGHPTPVWDIPALPAMGALRSSAHDMLTFLAANMDPSSQPLGRAMASAQVPRVEMDEETRVGLGWQTGHSTNRTVIWHGGGTGGFRSLIAFDPGTGLGVVVLCNSATGVDDLGFHLLDPSLPLATNP
jgi:CubicO group peptidase (beta-lactamase class C family)